MQYLTSLFIILVLYFNVVQNKKAKIPNYVKICKQNDPNLDQCVTDCINDLKPYFAIGIPEMKIYPFDPLVIAQTQFTTQNLEAVFTENEFHKGQNFDLKYLHFDVDNNVLIMNISYAELMQTGNYNLTGRLLTFQLNGNGKFNVNYTQIEVYSKLSGERIIKNGKEYLDFQTVDYQMKLGDFKMQLDDLFVGNPELTMTTNRILNENSQSLLPDFEEICRNILSGYTLG
ncbi:hemolymph juvenile hormone-binding protein, partial [Oryctes borbonicus]